MAIKHFNTNLKIFKRYQIQIKHFFNTIIIVVDNIKRKEEEWRRQQELFDQADMVMIKPSSEKKHIINNENVLSGI